MTINDDDLSRWEAHFPTVAGEVRAAPDRDIALEVARTAVPDLCKEVRRLRALDQKLRASTGALYTAVLTERDAAIAEASELRACLADAVGKIEVMRAENGRLRALVRNLEQCVVWNDSTQRYELYQRVAGLLEQAREVKP